MACLRRHGNNPGMVKQGLSTFAKVLSETGFHMKNEFVDAGVCDVVVSCLSQHMDHAAVIESGLSVLEKLLHTESGRNKLISSINLYEQIVFKFPDNAQAQRQLELLQRWKTKNTGGYKI